MQRILCFLLLPFIGLCSSAIVVNQTSSHIVMEATTNRILEGNDIHKQFLVASTAKILTAITAIENYPLEEEIIVTKKDISEVGSKVYLKENEKIKRKDLLYALMLRSANDAASALSYNNSPIFIRQMNELCKKIGMKNSVFVNASGLDETNYNLSTAYDMALLSSYANQNETFKAIASAHNYQCVTEQSTYSWHNKHKLVTSKNEFIWGKTGYTKKSRRILVSCFEKDYKKLIVVTINDGNDWNHHQELVNQTDYYFITILKKGVYNTKQDVNYYLYIPSDVTLPVKKHEDEKVNLHFKLYQKQCILEIYLNQILVLKKNIDVYDKSDFDVDLVIDLFH